MNALHNRPIYFVDVLVYVYENKRFIEDKIIKDVMIKGLGRKDILTNRLDELIKRTSKKMNLLASRKIEIKDLRLISQHGFGINEDS